MMSGTGLSYLRLGILRLGILRRRSSSGMQPRLPLLECNHVRHIKRVKTKLRQMMYVMKVVQKYAEQEDCWNNDKTKWTAEFVSNIWSTVGEKYSNALYGGKKRNSELSWKTVYNKMSAKNRLNKKIDCCNSMLHKKDEIAAS